VKRQRSLVGRRAAMTGLAGFTAAPLSVLAQQSLREVGFLHPATIESSPTRLAGFAEGLRKRGFIEGQNVSVVARWAGYDSPRIPIYAAELTKRNVAVIFAVGREVVQSSRAATTTIPIVALDLESDPVQSGFVVSLSRPGGNLTGLFFDFPEFTGKWLELLGEIIPGLKRVGALWDPKTGSVQVEALKSAAAQRDVVLEVLQIEGPDLIDDRFRAAVAAKVQAVLAVSSPVFGTATQEMATAALRYRMPCITPYPEFGRAGGLIAYGVEVSDLFRQGGELVGKVLGGMKPADLPVERPSTFEMVLNAKTAKALGLTIPPSILARADEVIE
jgi:putative ABC transport system substrate-binding protein